MHDDSFFFDNPKTPGNSSSVFRWHNIFSPLTANDPYLADEPLVIPQNVRNPYAHLNGDEDVQFDIDGSNNVSFNNEIYPNGTAEYPNPTRLNGNNNNE